MSALRGNQRISISSVSAVGTFRSKGGYVVYQRPVFHVPTVGTPHTKAWYLMYQCVVLPVPTVGISRTKAWYYFGTRNLFMVSGLQNLFAGLPKTFGFIC
ncbi:hypothetical protein [Bacteroides clarus]|uniref:hypothetical protein n=1 Tax=Bacteroides clarus TaxID=626929 RepID=UPI003522FFFF